MKNKVNSRTEIGNKQHYLYQCHSLAANLYLPEDFDASKKHPTVIFSGPFNQVKEQTGAVYGRKLADRCLGV